MLAACGAMLFWRRSISANVALISRQTRWPFKVTLQCLMGKFETTDCVNDQPIPIRRRNSRSAENIPTVSESMQENPRQSIPRRAQELDLSQTLTWRILRRACIRTRSNWPRGLKLMSIENAVCSLTRFRSIWKRTAIFVKNHL